jgi:hypothetical protein
MQIMRRFKSTVHDRSSSRYPETDSLTRRPEKVGLGGCMSTRHAATQALVQAAVPGEFTQSVRVCAHANKITHP